MSQANTYRVWGRVVRLLHWALALGYGALVLGIDPQGPWHRSIGTLIGMALLLRLLWGLVGPYQARLSALWPSPLDIRDQIGDLARGEKTFHIGHSPLSALLALMMLIGVAGLVVTGLLLGNGPGMATAHHGFAVWTNLLIAGHLASVLWVSLRTGVNHAWAMVTGIKPLPDPVYWQDDTETDRATPGPGARHPGTDPERRIFPRRGDL